MTLTENAENNSIIELNVKFLKFWGLILPQNVYKKYFYITMHLLVMLFTLTEVIDMFTLTYNFDQLITNMKITMLACISCVKVGTFLIWQEDWIKLINFVIRADKTSKREADGIDKKTIDSFANYSRKGSLIYAFLTSVTVIAVIVLPIYKYVFSPIYRENVLSGKQEKIQVVSSWVPFDKNNLIGYLAASAYQTFAAVYGGGWMTSFDSTSMVIMVFFNQELQLMKRDGSKIYDGADEDVLDRIKKLHFRRLELSKFCNLYDACISPIMFLYMFVCSVMICASIYQMVHTGDSSTLQRFLMAEYVVFGITQLFLFCWHGNQVSYASNETIRGIYNSAWWKTNLHRRELMLLSWQLDRKILFSAGPFFTLTVSTFISIVKAAYSFYTIMSKAAK